MPVSRSVATSSCSSIRAPTVPSCRQPTARSHSSVAIACRSKGRALSAWGACPSRTRHKPIVLYARKTDRQSAPVLLAERTAGRGKPPSDVRCTRPCSAEPLLQSLQLLDQVGRQPAAKPLEISPHFRRLFLPLPRIDTQ